MALFSCTLIHPLIHINTIIGIIGVRTVLRAEKLRMGSSAARETELSMIKTRMRLVKIWWLISLWQKTRNLQGRGRTRLTQRQVSDTTFISTSPHLHWYINRFCCSYTDRTTGMKPIGDLRVGAAEDKEGAALWDGRSLLFDGEFWQPLGTGPRGNVWKVVVVVIATRWNRRSSVSFLSDWGLISVSQRWGDLLGVSTVRDNVQLGGCINPYMLSGFISP